MREVVIENVAVGKGPLAVQVAVAVKVEVAVAVVVGVGDLVGGKVGVINTAEQYPCTAKP